jgi:hypothetical protein
MKLPAIPASLTAPKATDPPALKFDLDALGKAYYALACGQLGELKKRMKDAVAGTQALANGTEALQMRRMIVQGTWDTWYRTTRGGLTNSNAGWIQSISPLIAEANSLEADVTAVYPEPPGQGPTDLQALTPERVAALTSAVRLTRDLPGQLEPESAGPKIGNVFRPDQVADVRTRMVMICKTLNVYLANTKAGVVGQSECFVVDTSLSDSMPCLASGSGAGAYIRINPRSLDTFTAKMMAISLVHEGSHILADTPTVDFAYRKGGAFYAVPAALRLRNAAHYEHLAASFIDPVNKVSIFAATPEAFAAAILQAKITRAWVRANDLKAGNGPLRLTFANVFGFDPNKIGDEPFLALANGLYYVVNLAMRMTTNDATTLTYGPAPGLTLVNGAAQLTVQSGASPSAMAQAAIRLICHNLCAEGQTGLPEDSLVAFIDGIAAYDRLDLQDHLKIFLDTMDKPPIGAGQPVPKK